MFTEYKDIGHGARYETVTRRTLVIRYYVYNLTGSWELILHRKKNIFYNILISNHYKRRQQTSKTTVCEIASSCPNIIYLYLGCSKNVSDISLIEIVKFYQKLEYINKGSGYIPDVLSKEIACSQTSTSLLDEW